jgi:cell division protein FtsI (penicillin-binding protein 3)
MSLHPKDDGFASTKYRLLVIVGLLCFGLSIGWIKSGMLQLVRGDALRHIAEKQYLRSTLYTAQRGNILDREGKPLSISVPVDSVYAEPRRIVDPTSAIAQIHKAAPNFTKKSLERLSSDRSFSWVARRVDPNTAKRVKNLNLEGIGFAKEERRFYPNHSLAGQTLGLLSIDGKAVSGIEKSFDQYLKPKSWSTLSWNDARGTGLRTFVAPDVSQLKGDDLYLTIDRDIQYVAEEVLLRTMVEHGAKGGWAIVIKPKTGEVLALANVPLMNPNHMSAHDTNSRRNNAIARTGEPGSTFKMITFAAAFDANLISLDEKIFCENGKWDLGYMVVKDITKKGYLTPGEIFKYSSNIGTYKIAQRLGKKRISEVIERFGFGQPPGLNLIEEARGYVSDYQKWGLTRFANVSFGYGIMASSFQMTLAVAAIANGGMKVAPRILSRIQKPDGMSINPTPYVESTRVISEYAAAKMTEIMVADTEGDGTGKRAAIPGVKVAGKTGTAEKLDAQTGRYAKNLNLSSFIGFAPADNPEIAAMVVIDEPQGIAYGGYVAAPAWREIVTAALIKSGSLSQDPDPALPTLALKVDKGN